MRAVGALTAVFLCVLCVVAASPAAVTLSNGLVTPTVGPTGGLFGFRVTFTDTTGTAPTVKEAWIDGVGPYTMSLRSGSYATGAVFALPCYPSAGTHNFRFYFSNANGSARFPAVFTLEGPVVSAKYNITDYFPLTETGSWTYHANWGTATGTATRAVNYWGHFQWTFIDATGSIEDHWRDTWNWNGNWEDLRGLLFIGEEDLYPHQEEHPLMLMGTLNGPGTPFEIPNGLYVGQTATVKRTAYNWDATPSGDVWCTYRVDGVETISVPKGTYNCLKVTISFSGLWWVKRIDMWLAKNVGPIEIVRVDNGDVRVDRLLSYTP